MGQRSLRVLRLHLESLRGWVRMDIDHVKALASGAGRLRNMVPLKITYDEVANAAYIYFQAPDTRAATMYACDPVDVNGMINLDFDTSGRLVGLEVLDARAKLAPELLAAAKNITRRTAGG